VGNFKGKSNDSILQGELIKRDPGQVEKSITDTDYPIGSGCKAKRYALLYIARG